MGARVRVPARADLRRTQTISSGDRPDSEEVTKQAFPTTVGGLVGLNGLANCDEDICVSQTAGCSVPGTTPAPEIMYKHAQGAQKSLKAKKK